MITPIYSVLHYRPANSESTQQDQMGTPPNPYRRQRGFCPRLTLPFLQLHNPDATVYEYPLQH